MSKQGEDRYARASRNWGMIAVHPTDLEEKYRQLYTQREQKLRTEEGGTHTRTTSLAAIKRGVVGLLNNGYYVPEVLGIVANVASQVQTSGVNAAEARAKECQEELKRTKAKAEAIRQAALTLQRALDAE